MLRILPIHLLLAPSFALHSVLSTSRTAVLPAVARTNVRVHWLPYLPQTLTADTTYGNGELLPWLEDRGIAPYIRVKENPNGPTDFYDIDQFTYMSEENCFICPEGKPLKYVGINPRNRTHLYYSTPKRCGDCSQKSRCTRGKYRSIAIHTCELAQKRARARAETPAFAISERARRKAEALSAN